MHAVQVAVARLRVAAAVQLVEEELDRDPVTGLARRSAWLRSRRFDCQCCSFTSRSRAARSSENTPRRAALRSSSRPSVPGRRGRGAHRRYRRRGSSRPQRSESSEDSSRSSARCSAPVTGCARRPRSRTAAANVREGSSRRSRRSGCRAWREWPPGRRPAPAGRAAALVGVLGEPLAVGVAEDVLEEQLVVAAIGLEQQHVGVRVALLVGAHAHQHP